MKRIWRKKHDRSKSGCPKELKPPINSFQKHQIKLKQTFVFLSLSLKQNDWSVQLQLNETSKTLFSTIFI